MIHNNDFQTLLPPPLLLNIYIYIYIYIFFFFKQLLQGTPVCKQIQAHIMVVEVGHKGSESGVLNSGLMAEFSTPTPEIPLSLWNARKTIGLHGTQFENHTSKDCAHSLVV